MFIIFFKYRAVKELQLSILYDMIIQMLDKTSINDYIFLGSILL